MITQSSLSSLQYTKGYLTRSESISSFKMTIEQLVDQKNFKANVRESANTSLSLQTQIISTQTEREIVYMRNEHRLISQFSQNISYIISEVFQICNLLINFADYQASQNDVKYKNIFDQILIDDQHEIQAVSESKTF